MNGLSEIRGTLLRPLSLFSVIMETSGLIMTPEAALTNVKLQDGMLHEVECCYSTRDFQGSIMAMASKNHNNLFI